MSIQIGRFGLGLAERTGAPKQHFLQPEPSLISHNGDAVQIEGWANGAVNAAAPGPFTQFYAAAARRQITGLAENAEFAVPIISETTPLMNGLYRIMSAEVIEDPVTHGDWQAGYNGWFRYRVTALRLSGPFPLVESRFFGALRPNDHALALDRPWWGLPSGAAGSVRLGPGLAAADQVLVHGKTAETSENAEFDTYYEDNSVGQEDSSIIYTLPATQWYVGACDVIFGTVPIPGTTTPEWNLHGVGAWGFGNGLVKVTNPIGGAGNGTFADLHVYSGHTDGWEKLGALKIGTAASGYPTDCGKERQLTILRNSPEEAVVRLSVDDGTGSPTLSGRRIDIDMRVRRGARHVEVGISAHSERWRIGVSGGNALTDLGGWGGYRSSNDSDGNRYCIMCAHSNGVGLAGGESYMTLDAPRSTADFAVFAELGGDTATLSDDVLVGVENWLWAASERMRVLRA